MEIFIIFPQIPAYLRAEPHCYILGIFATLCIGRLRRASQDFL